MISPIQSEGINCHGLWAWRPWDIRCQLIVKQWGKHINGRCFQDVYYPFENIHVKLSFSWIIKNPGCLVSDSIDLPWNVAYWKRYVSSDAPLPYLFGNVITWEGAKTSHVACICHSGGTISHNSNATIGHFLAKRLQTQENCLQFQAINIVAFFWTGPPSPSCGVVQACTPPLGRGINVQGMTYLPVINPPFRGQGIPDPPRNICRCQFG